MMKPTTQFTAVLFLLASLASAKGATAGSIQTTAGTGTAGYTGDGGPATAAQLNLPVFVATDPGGNVYIADQKNNVIRKVDLAGVITTVAGTGVAGFAGDNGPATQAQLNSPTGVFVDPQGDLLVADVGNQRIRKVTPAGIITTVAGNGGMGFGGDGGPATSASFYNSDRAVADAAGNIYIADQSDHRIRIVNAAGIISTFAGTGTQGFSGDNGPATSAMLDNPTAVALDAAGNLFIADQFNQRIRKVSTAGIITTVAGSGQIGYSGDGGPAISAALNYPGGLIVDDSGNIFFNDDLNFVARKVAADGTISTVAGNGAQGSSGDGGPATSASLNGNFGIAIDPAGDLLIADSANNRIRLVASASPVAPLFQSISVTNGASFVSGGSAGALATVFGQHLSVNLSGLASSTTLPLLTQLAGASVTVNGVPAPLLAVANAGGGEQINFQIPWEAASASSVQVVVNNGIASSAATVELSVAQPGIFLIDGVNGATEHLDGAVVSTSNPAAPGEYVVVFATGLGPVNPPVVTGQAAPATTLSTTTITPSVTIGGLPATVLFSGEAPYFVGLNQLNIQVPAGASSGSQDMTITVNGIMSNVAKIQVQ